MQDRDQKFRGVFSSLSFPSLSSPFPSFLCLKVASQIQLRDLRSVVSFPSAIENNTCSHQTEVEATTKKPFTRSQCLHSLSEQNKSALTDHASRDNHLIKWSQATILDRESDRGTRWIKEAVHIRKEGRSSMNRDEGSDTLSHTYDRFLATSHHYRGKNRKKN